jgi:hypothetical protein
MAKVWEPAFPHLGAWACKSPATRKYNCYAFAAGDKAQRWEPDPGLLYYWPAGVVRNYSISAFIAAYQTIYYQLCVDGLPDLLYEKICIYATADGIVRHVARQIFDGRWISKLGHEEDIIHQTPESLRSAVYGQPVNFMKRTRWKVRGRFAAIWRVRM